MLGCLTVSGSGPVVEPRGNESRNVIAGSRRNAAIEQGSPLRVSGESRERVGAERAFERRNVIETSVVKCGSFTTEVRRDKGPARG